MTQVNFTIISQLNGNKDQLLAGTNSENGSTILITKEKVFPLEVGEELIIKLKQNGNFIDLGNGFDIWVLPPQGFKTKLTTTKDELKITLESLESLPHDRANLCANVTVGTGPPG